MGIDGVVDKLPSRPLTVAEGDELASKESERSWIRPESTIVRDNGDVVVALMAVDRVNDRAWLIGYDPDAESWSRVEEWGYEEIDHDRFYERLQEWVAKTFGGRAEWSIS